MEWCLSTSVDWTVTRELITAVVQILGLLLAFAGFLAWRRQIVGKTEHELALAALRCARLVQEEIRDLRQPSFAFHFAPSDPVDTDPDDPRHFLLRPAQKIYNERLSRLHEKVVNLKVAGLDAESLWGPEASERVTALVMCTRKFRFAVWRYWMRPTPRSIGFSGQSCC